MRRHVGSRIDADGQHSAGQKRSVLDAGRIVGVDDDQAAGGYLVKQFGLGAMIVGQRLVIVEMIAPQIRQADVAKLDAGDAPLARWRGSKPRRRRAITRLATMRASQRARSGPCGVVRSAAARSTESS